MKPTAPLALALCLTLATAAELPAQQPAPPKPAPFTDPANLAGERVTPLNGHELPIDQGPTGLAELLRKLSTRASILNIVAHPDDEDGGMLTLYARGLGARVTDLSLTRGEGGQNFVTGDFEDALGLIRTQELLANDRYTGVTQLFGTEVDFGFSKTREEAFQKWTHDRVLYDAVRAIRIIRPLVITATFIGNVTDGHGQHQVSGEIAQEAFKAAADPKVFPEMIAEGILPWQALKVYARVPFASIDSKGVYDYATNQYVPARFTNYVTGAVTTTKPNADIEVPEGNPDPLLTAAAAGCDHSVISTEAQRSGETCSFPATNPSEHLSYLQFARIGLGMQRSQISKSTRLPVSGFFNSGYTLYGSVLCNAPASAQDPNIAYNLASKAATNAPTQKVAPTKNSVILSGARSAESKDPCISPAAALPPTSATQEPLSGTVSAQMSVILSGADRAFASSAAEGPAGLAPSNNSVILSGADRAFASSTAEVPAVLAPSNKSVILSGADRAFASSAAEGPATNPAPTRLLTNSHPPTPNTPTPSPSSRPKRSAVERPLYVNAAYTPTNPTTQPATNSGTSRYPEPSASGTKRYPEASASGLITPEETGVLTPGYAPNEATTPADLTTNPTFFTGIDTSIESIATLAPDAPPTLRTQLAAIATNIAKATQDFNPNNPSVIAPSLAAALHTDDALINQLTNSQLPAIQKENVLHELRIKRAQLNEALQISLGLSLDAVADSANQIAGSSIIVKTHLSQTSNVPVTFQELFIADSLGIAAPAPPTHVTPTLDSAHTIDTAITISPRDDTHITRPYFHREQIEQPVYELIDPALRNAPSTPPAFVATAIVGYSGARIMLFRVVHDGPQPISIIPPVSIASAPTATVLPTGQPTAQLAATLTTEAHTSANINVQSPKGWSIQAKAASTNSVNFILHPPATFTGPATFHLTATTPDHHTYTEGWRAVGYPGLILTNYYTPATTRVVPVDLQLPEHVRIAYLPGTGDAVPEALASIGLAPTLITVADLTAAKLSSFDTVVLGVRSYTAHPDLNGAPTQALLDFARNGGNVVVQYQTSDFTSADAPYPLDLGPGAKVVVETDPVELLIPATKGTRVGTNGVAAGTNGNPAGTNGNPVGTNGVAVGTNGNPAGTNGVAAGFSPRPDGHGKSGALAPATNSDDDSVPAKNRYPEPSGSGLIAKEGKGVLTPGYALLTTPNLITPADFNNWVSERGHGFLATWDPHYTALTDTHDPGGDGTMPQPPQRGGLITTQVGKGRWTYVAFALYRQLPEAVPGAFRLFVNLVTPPR